MSSNSIFDIFSRPEFSPLASCLLVESSHRSKTDIHKQIKGTDLFKEITIARSMIHGLELVSLRDFDACIIGPSLRPESTSKYIDSLQEASRANDCAMIVLTKEGVDMSVFSKADAIVIFPASILKFFEGIVKGLLKANKGSPWPGIRLNDYGVLEVHDNGIWKSLVSNIEPVYEGLDEDFLLEASPESIEKFCSGIQKTPKSKLEKIILLLLSNNDSDDPFIEFFKQSVRDWKDNLEFSTLKEATLNLKWKLLDFEKRSRKE
jgi:hypothetical protein